MSVGNITSTNIVLHSQPSAITLAAIQTIAVSQVSQGIAGPVGPPGAIGTGFVWDQPTPADTWTVSHNLGLRPAVSIYSVGGVEMMGTVQHLSIDVLKITFSIPVAGSARLN